MAVIISPLYPVTGDTVTLTIDNATGSDVAFEISTIPTGGLTPLGLIEFGTSLSSASSTLRAEQDAGRAGSVTDQLAFLAAEGRLTNQQIFLTAGEYTITAFDMRVWNQPPGFESP